MAEITLQISKARISSTKCCVKSCIAQFPVKLHRVSQQMRHELMKSNRLYIQANARACEFHNDLSVWPGIPMENEESKFTVPQIEEMVDLLRSSPKHPKKPPLNQKSDFEFKTDSGLTRAQFMDLFSRQPSTMNKCTTYENIFEQKYPVRT